jgi:peroxiredoxin
MRCRTKNTLVLGLALLTAAAAAQEPPDLPGTVTGPDGGPAPGAVVYAAHTERAMLSLFNGDLPIAEHLPRAMTDRDGRFTLELDAAGPHLLYAEDLAGRTGWTLWDGDAPEAMVRVEEAAWLHGRLMRGPNPAGGLPVEAMLTDCPRNLRYRLQTTSGPDGRFAFPPAVSGHYTVVVREPVPQVGCAFRDVATFQGEARLEPGGQAELALGGTNHPVVRGRVTTDFGEPLHGVWVRLEKPQRSSFLTPQRPGVVWSTVTDRDGRYMLYDVPAGDYILHCFRRLALNSSRTLQKSLPISVSDDARPDMDTGLPTNRADVAIDLVEFEPLPYDAPVPDINARTLDGAPFSLAAHRGKVVVLHFYAGWCGICRVDIDTYDRLAEWFDGEDVAVVGVSLDMTEADARAVVEEEGIAVPVLYDGNFETSQIREAFRVGGVPATFVIDGEGRLVQTRVFGDVVGQVVERLVAGEAVDPAGNEMRATDIPAASSLQPAGGAASTN